MNPSENPLRENSSNQDEAELSGNSSTQDLLRTLHPETVPPFLETLSDRRELLRLWESVFENTGTLMALIDEDHLVVRVNRELERVFGLLRSDIEGRRKWWEFVPESERPRLLEYHRLRRISTDAAPRHFELEAKDATGKTLYLKATAALIAGTSTSILSLIDITQEKHRENDYLQAAANYRSIFENALEGIYQTTPDGRFLSANPALARILGWPSPSALMDEFVDMTKLYLEPEMRQDFVNRMRRDGAVSGFEARIKRKDGIEVWISENSREVRGPEGSLLHYEGTVEDITERKRTEEENARLAEFPRTNPNPILTCDALGGITYMNPAATAHMERFHMKSVTEFLPSDHAAITQACLQEGYTSRHFEVFVQDRLIAWLYHPLPKSGVVYLYGMDVTERRVLERQAAQGTLHDPITGLPNRTLFLERLRLSMERATRHRQVVFAVLLLDLDRFKVINESLGHQAGDQMLVQAGDRLSSCVHPGDSVARLGGDEFAMLLDDLKSPEQASQAADFILRRLSEPFELGGREIFGTASVGVALSTKEYRDPEDFLRDAENAMYRAKAGGKGRFSIYDEALHLKAHKALEMEISLRQALKTWDFEVHYQPIVDMREGAVSGFEALVRWRKSDGSYVMPMDFIPIAEETGLIGEIDGWVFAHACRQAALWQASLPPGRTITISVNVSGRQLSDEGLVERVANTLASSGLSPRSLRLELTETVLMANPDQGLELMTRLRDMGVKLALDDFGTGYSSLSYLHRFPFHILKIDRSFVMRMKAGDRNWEIVRTIKSLADGLGMEVVAEGVETADQLALLMQLHCQYGQGYLWSKPQPPELAFRQVGKPLVGFQED